MQSGDKSLGNTDFGHAGGLFQEDFTGILSRLFLGRILFYTRVVRAERGSGIENEI